MPVEDESKIISFEGPADLYHPLNWPMKKKLYTTVLYGATTMGATLASSIFAPVTKEFSAQFHISQEVGNLATSLVLFGFGLGPLVWGPVSEAYGRKPAVILPFFIAAMFTFASAVSKDVQSLMITRFFTGLFGSAPVTNSGGVLNDIWTPEHRGAAIVAYALTLVLGIVLGPIIGGAIAVSSLSWRWTEYITGIFMTVIFIIDVIVIDESYPPVLLVRKARQLRLETDNWALHANHEERHITWSVFVHKYLFRPIWILSTPICFFVALYASFVYGILYLNLSSISVEFQTVRGWNALVGSLPFLAVLVGIILGACVNLMNQRFYARKLKASGSRAAIPEARLPPMMVGSVFFASGMFIFGWTGQSNVLWVGPVIGAGCLGFGFFTIFQASLNYLVDTFRGYSASAIAANTFLRSAFSGAFPLFADIMYRRMGVPWASSLLGFISLAMIPIPFVLYAKGAQLRARSSWSSAEGS